MLAKVSHRLGAYATGPNITIRRDLRRSDPCHARNHLSLLAQGSLHQLVVLKPEGLSDFGQPGQLLIAQTLEQRVDGQRVALYGGGDAETHRVELHAFLGDLRDERVRFELA